MFRKILVVALAGVLIVGVTAAAVPAPAAPAPIDCLDSCAPTLTLSGGTVCVLAGCFDTGTVVLCAYNCFYPLPPWPPLL